MFSVQVVFTAPDRNMTVALPVGVEGTGMTQGAAVQAQSTRICSLTMYYSNAASAVTRTWRLLW